MTKDELATILAKHKQWLNDEMGGARANLSGAYLSGAYLSDADLRRANLSDANLSGADLSDADLSDADLRRANLSGANLSGAYLSDADLSDADLRRANLSGANLSGAYLSGAYLSDANLSDANLSGADLSDADLRRADLRRADLKIPVVENLDAKMAAAIGDGTGTLEMGAWHTCETTHCQAGWAIQLAGPDGAALEAAVGPAAAGALIYAASGSHPVPNFYASNADALAEIKRRAAAAASAAPKPVDDGEVA